MKKTLLLFLSALIPFLLISCSKRPSITNEQMLIDMNGQSIMYTSTLEKVIMEWKFDNSKTFNINKFTPIYSGDEAEITATVYNESIYIPNGQKGDLIKYNLQGQGDVRLIYNWVNNAWKLIKIESISFTDKGPWTK